MTATELVCLRQTKGFLQDQLAQRDELIAQMQQEQLKKDSLNSYLPPATVRFHRRPQYLRPQSEKKP